jgi:L-threonylcarbamoyladenylate synthase
MGSAIAQVSEAQVDSADIRRAAEVLRDGGIVLLPTETVYGAAGVLSHPEARKALRTIRGGEDGRPLTIHVPGREQARQYIGPVNELAERMLRKLWPGPVGLLFTVPEPRQREVAGRLGVEPPQIYDGDSITLRCPDHQVALEVLRQVDQPVVMTAVGRSPYTGPGEQLPESLQENVDLVLDAGPTRFSRPSTLLRVGEDGYEVVRTGVYDERIIDRMLKTTILFVCSGNTCRSPMAEAIARRVLADRMQVKPDELENKGVNVLSAGSFAFPGARATPHAADAVQELGGDLSSHRSRPLSVELIHQADAIFVMGRSHAEAVTALVPSAREKVRTLHPERDIEDPIGGDAGLYRELAGEMKKLIEQRLNEESLRQ